MAKCFSMLNQLKEEYIYARFLLFEATKQAREVHYADKNVKIALFGDHEINNVLSYLIGGVILVGQIELHQLHILIDVVEITSLGVDLAAEGSNLRGLVFVV